MKDIEVFILTRNRVDLLKSSAESILNQTHKVKLTIVDNCSEDNTEAYVKELMEKCNNVNYYRQPEFVIFEKNLKTAQNMAQADYVMFFHDDDILHPQYIEFAYKLINKYDDVDLICGLSTAFKNQNEIKTEYLKQVKYSLFKNKKEFISHVYSAFCTDYTDIVFPHVIYKTQNIKDIKIETERYGKIADKPFVIDALQKGIVIQIRDKRMLNYRIHEGQDSATTKNGPFPNEIIAHNIKFKEILNNNMESRVIFDNFSAKWLNILFKWGGNGNNKQEFKNFIKQAYEQDAINWFSYALFFSPLRFFYKFINKKIVKYITYKDKHIKELDLILENNSEKNC